MMRFLPFLALTGCFAEGDGEPCPTGVRETFTDTIETSTGPVTVETTMCVASRWESTACEEEGTPEACRYFFEPNTPPSAPPQLIFGDFVGTLGVGHLELSGPAVLDGSSSIQAGLTAEKEAAQAAGFRTSTVQPLGLINEYEAYSLTVSCDHPDTDEICPYTWDYLLVDLSIVAPGVYGDFSAIYAADVDAGNNAAEPIEEFVDWDTMVGTITVTTK